MGVGGLVGGSRWVGGWGLVGVGGLVGGSRWVGGLGLVGWWE